MKIGVVVPCFSGHIPHLMCLLDSIEMQTRKPDKVVVSCSSTADSIPLPKTYSFPLVILVTKDKKNAAQNRNIAGKWLLQDEEHIDYITFMDADDIMHPQRIEILVHVFQTYNPDIILHNFLLGGKECSSVYNMERIEEGYINIRINALMQCSSGCIRHKDFYKYIGQRIHHSQSSVPRHIFEAVKYPEQQEYFGREDCVFCYRVFERENMQTVYIANPLSLYCESGTQK